jgi:hypothetical protein
MNRSEFNANEALATSRNTGWNGSLGQPSKARKYYVQSKRKVSQAWMIVGNLGLWLVVLPLVAKFN